jgi:glyoxylase-like metal-dependent hydrolase (beta-lactamase superfamily II)
MSETTSQIRRVQGQLMAVNSYLVEGPDGIVVVDGQLTLADADQVRAAADALGKPIAGMVLTHGHPDHYAGAAQVLRGLDVAIVAAASVDEVIRRDDAEKDAIVGPMMGEQWPTHRRFPDEVIADGDTVHLGGVALRVRELGPAESPADTLWTLDERTVFTGDVAYDGMHAYLADARFREWLAVLDVLTADLPRDVRLYPGHGRPAGVEVIEVQRRYVESFVAAVEAHGDRDPDDRRDAVVARMREVVPSDDLLFLMELSIEPVLAALQDGDRADA